MVEKVPMTQKGFDKLREELRMRQQEERPRIIEAISEARAHGDLSENAEYHAAKESQSLNEGRIGELKTFSRVPKSSTCRRCPATRSSSAPPSSWSTRTPRKKRPTRSSATRRPM
jgi:hypothetical protein